MPEVMKRLVGPRALVNVGGTVNLNLAPGGYDLGTTSGTQVYTVPTGAQTVVRSVQVYATTTYASFTYLLYGSSSVDNWGNRLPAPQNAMAVGTPMNTTMGFANLAPTGTFTYRWLDTLVLNSGESLWMGFNWNQAGITPSAKDSLYVLVHGVEIS